MAALIDPRHEALAQILASDPGASMRAAAAAAGFPPGMVKGKSYTLARRADVQQRIAEIRESGVSFPPPMPVAHRSPKPFRLTSPTSRQSEEGVSTEKPDSDQPEEQHAQAAAVSAMGTDDLRRWLTGIAALSVLRAQELGQHRVVFAGVGELGKLHGLHSVRVDHQHTPFQAALGGLPARTLGAILDGLARIESAMSGPGGGRHLDLTLGEARALGVDAHPGDVDERGLVRVHIDETALCMAATQQTQEVATCADNPPA